MLTKLIAEGADMQIKVSDILAIPALKDSYIINERTYSDNLIDKIEILNDIEALPSTNVLYIAGDKITDSDEDSFTEFVKLCNDNLISGLVMPEMMLDRMNEFKAFMAGRYCPVNIPVIVIRDGTTYCLTAFCIQSQISQYYRAELDKIIEVNNSFNHISLKAPDIKSIIECFKRVVNNPVMIYDEFLNVIVTTDNYIVEHDEVPGTKEKNFLHNLYFYKQQIIFRSSEAPIKECTRVLFPITFENRDKAYLAVFEINTPLSSVDYTILEICATASLVEMKRVMALKKIEEKFLNDFLYDLIYRTDNKKEEIRRRAEVLSINEDSDYCAIIFDLHSKDSYKIAEMNEVEEINDKILNTIDSYIKSSNKQSLVSKFGKSILILHRVENTSTENYTDIKAMCEKLNSVLVGRYYNVFIQAGIGSIINNIEQISKSYREALSSVSYGRTIYGENATFIVSYNDSSLLKIFSKIKEKDSLYEIVPENLKELKKFDAESKSNLIETLSVYLDCNCNAKKASEKMFIHYKTMLYRLEKIFNDFGIDLDSSSSRLQIELGLQVMNILDIQSENMT